jgi:hypothetical protein
MTRIAALPMFLLAVAMAGLAPTASAFVAEDMDKLMFAVRSGQPVDCRGCNLSYANLSGFDLSGADLEGAYMSGARLNNTVLRGARLDHADLSRADLTCTDFTGASMADVRTVSAKWCGTVMPDGTLNSSRCE